MTRPYAEVIGDPIAHSKSPLIHRFWLARLGIEADYRATHVRPAELAVHFVKRRADPSWRGCNVTLPHKVAALVHVDSVDATAIEVGAINTVFVENDALMGYNTDVDGVVEALNKVGRSPRPYPKHVATYVQIIGAGGAARAAVIGAARAGYFDFDVFARSVERAKPVAELAGTPFGTAQPLACLGPIRNDDDGPDDQRYSHVVINATTMGMTGNDPVPIDLDRYYLDTLVFDMVYAPLVTPLLAAARERGLRTIDGLAMLIGQAAVAFELFFGQPAPRQHDAELRALLTA